MKIGKNRIIFSHQYENEDDYNNDCQDFDNNYFQNDSIEPKST